MNNNRKRGNSFEDELCKMLHERTGAWVHNMKQSNAGQPADIIMVYRGAACLIDAKLCEKDAFVFTRVEPNQRYAMDKFSKQEGFTYFIVKFAKSGNIYCIPYVVLLTAEALGYKQFTEEDLIRYNASFDSWMKKCTSVSDQ